MATILELPDIEGWAEIAFDPVRPRAVDRMEGRRTEGQAIGTAYWTARYVSPYLFRVEYGRLDAFMMRAGDDGEVFRAHDAFRPRPIRQDTGVPLSGVRAGSGAFDGTATLSVITNSRAVTVTGLPAGFLLSQGDYVEFRQSGQSSLHRVMADATASAGGSVALSIKYGLDLQNFTTAAVVRFEKPSCLMQIDPGSWQGPKSRRNRTVSFQATEVVVP